jgi:hypothetical protein
MSGTMVKICSSDDVGRMVTTARMLKAAAGREMLLEEVPL